MSISEGATILILTPGTHISADYITSCMPEISSTNRPGFLQCQSMPTPRKRRECASWVHRLHWNKAVIEERLRATPAVVCGSLPKLLDHGSFFSWQAMNECRVRLNDRRLAYVCMDLSTTLPHPHGHRQLQELLGNHKSMLRYPHPVSQFLIQYRLKVTCFLDDCQCFCFQSFTKCFLEMFNL